MIMLSELTAEISGAGKARFGGNGRSVAYLEHDALLRLVEDGVSVRGNDVGAYAKFADEIIDPLAQKASVGAVEGDELQCAHLLRASPQFVFQFVGIGIASGCINVETPPSVASVESAAADVQSVERGARHQADGL